jgi:PAS domain S-box-containing protein
MDVTEQRLARAALEKAVDEIKKSEDRLQLVIDTIPAMVWSALPDGSTDFVSQSWAKYYGLSLEDIERVGWEVVIHPNDVAKARDTTRAAMAAAKPFEHELRCRRADGQYRWLIHRAVPLRDEVGNIVKWFGTSTDIDDRKRAEMLLAGEKRLLEMIARGDSRALIFDALCRLVEELADGSLSSILLLDPKTNRLRHGAAASLPASYTQAIDGSAIGPSAGSCGTAAYRAEPVIVSDIATDPLWADYRELALPHGLRACWSTPILSSEGRVLGTSAIYYREPRSPTAQEQNLMEQITNLASIAIERAQAEGALRERARLLDLTHDTVFVRDMSDVITYWNRGAGELYGWTREEAVGQVTHQLTQTIFPAPLEEINAELLRTGRWEGELTHTRRDGTQVVVASRWSLQRNEQGLPAAILETNNDITERKRAEEELRVSQRNLRLLIEVIPGMVCLGSAEGEVEYVNQRVLDFTGKTLEDLAGFGWTSVLHPDDVERVLSTYLQSIATGQTHEVEYRLRRWDGTYRWIQSRADPLRDSEGRIINWYALVYDIDDRKNMEATLRKIQDELAHVSRVMTMGELTASIAHEIKQPLAAVVTNAGVCLRWLAGEPPNLDEAREAARRIIRDGNRANDVITRIRAILRKTDTPKAQLDINEAIQEVVLLTQHEAARKGVTLRLEFTAGLPPVFGDRVQLQQVALNLLMNGVEAMASVEDRPRELMISSRTNESGQVLVAVQDCGEGIDGANLEEIFNAFYTTKSQGMGMGLAISRSIIENHGGRLWASSNDGPGVTFQFTLQAYGMQEQESAEVPLPHQ